MNTSTSSLFKIAVVVCALCFSATSAVAGNSIAGSNISSQKYSRSSLNHRPFRPSIVNASRSRATTIRSTKASTQTNRLGKGLTTSGLPSSGRNRLLARSASGSDMMSGIAGTGSEKRALANHGTLGISGTGRPQGIAGTGKSIGNGNSSVSPLGIAGTGKSIGNSHSSVSPLGIAGTGSITIGTAGSGNSTTGIAGTGKSSYSPQSRVRFIDRAVSIPAHNTAVTKTLRTR